MGRSFFLVINLNTWILYPGKLCKQKAHAVRDPCHASFIDALPEGVALELGVGDDEML